MQVICSCNHERVDTEGVEFLHIEEGPSGEDRMTFVCPFCGEDHTSVVLAGGRSNDEMYDEEWAMRAREQFESYDAAYAAEELEDA